MSNDPSLLDGLRARYSKWLKRLTDDGLRPAQSDIVSLAVDGLWLRDMLGIDGGPAEKRRRRELFAALEAMTRDVPTAPRPVRGPKP